MKMIIATLAFAASVVGASAATIVNKDQQSYTLKITENGQQSEVGIAPGQSIDACSNGCFITLPNGDRETLSGSETVEITGGAAVIR
ncbi:MAG: hypothetical protein WBO55_02300 [Rhizobiaceae bacterium]